MQFSCVPCVQSEYNIIQYQNRIVGGIASHGCIKTPRRAVETESSEPFLWPWLTVKIELFLLLRRFVAHLQGALLFHKIHIKLNYTSRNLLRQKLWSSWPCLKNSLRGLTKQLNHKKLFILKQITPARWIAYLAGFRYRTENNKLGMLWKNKDGYFSQREIISSRIPLLESMKLKRNFG